MSWKLHAGMLAAVFLAAAGAGCRSPETGGTGDSLPPPLPRETADISRADERRARELYAVKCANCHRFYSPANYTDAEWSLWMGKMSRKARLEPDQEELLRRYLDAFRSGKGGVSDGGNQSGTGTSRRPNAGDGQLTVHR